MEQPIGKRLKLARKGDVDMTPLSNRIKGILEERNESLRAAGIKSGLDHQYVRRIVNGERPNMISCIMLADYFGINPNEFLQLAQWPTLQVFDIAYSSKKKQIPPDAVDLALELVEVTNSDSRRKIIRAFSAIVQEFKQMR